MIVKPLEWACGTAKSIIGVFSMHFRADGMVDLKLNGSFVGGPRNNVEDASAAAQARLEAVVGSVLAEPSDEQIIELAVAHSNYKEGAVFEVFSHSRVIEFARALLKRKDQSNV